MLLPQIQLLEINSLDNKQIFSFQALTDQLLSNERSGTPVLQCLFVNPFIHNVNTARFLKYVLPFFNLTNEMVTSSLSKKSLSFIPREQRPFWQLSQLGDFVVSGNANLFVPGKTGEPSSQDLFMDMFFFECTKSKFKNT